MKKKPGQRPYYRTAALLGAQQQPYSGRSRTAAQARSRSRASGSRARTPDLHLDIPWKLVALLMLVGAVALWLLVDSSWYLMGEDIRVIGATSQETALNAAIASDLLGWHGLRLQPRAAAAAITEQVAAITEAQVECSRFPAQCVIRVKERTPVLNWVTENAIHWVDAEGVLLPTHAVRADLPVVRGPLSSPVAAELGPGSFAAGNPALLAAAEKAEYRARVKVLEGVTALAALGITSEAWEYQPDRGLIWTDPQGRRVAFGVGADMETRWNIYVALIAHLEARAAAGNGVFPWTIDVRFPDGPTYSLERSW